MTDIWFYEDGFQSQGPVPFEGLLAVLASQSDWRRTFVWRAGFRDWMPAADVPEISVSLTKPPPLPSRRGGPWETLPQQKASVPQHTAAKRAGPVQASASEASQEAAKKKPSLLIRTVSFTALFIAGLIGLTIGKPIGREISNQLLGPSRSEQIPSRSEQIERGLQQAESTVRPTLPKKLDDHTTMVAISHSGSKLRYEYIVDLGADVQIKPTFTADVKATVLPKVCSTMGESLKYGVSYEYFYRDKKAASLGSFVITQADCPS